MKKKIMKGFILFLLSFCLIACGEKDLPQEEEKPTQKLSNSTVKVDGIYINEEYINEDGLNQVILFYTINAGENNIEVTSNTFNLMIGNNKYEPKIGIETPNLTQYYYSNIIEHVYVGKSLKVASIYEVPEGDLISDKTITLDDFNNYAEGIEFKTNTIKRLANMTEISLDVDKDYATKRQEEENDKLSAADDNTVKKVKKAINGYYFTIPSFVGQTYVTTKLEFSSPNKFTVKTSLGVKNSGTYTVSKGYIILKYKSNGKILYTPYKFENGDISIDSPFYSNGSDTIF